MQSIAARMAKFGVALEQAEVVVPTEQPEITDVTPIVVDGGAEEAVAFSEADAEVGQAEEVLDQLQEDHGQLTEVAVTLESFLKANKPLTPEAAAMASIAVRGATQRYGLTQAVPAMECFTGQAGALANTRVALESVSEKAKQLKEWILKLIDSLKNAWNKFITSAFDRFSWIKRAAEAALANAEKADGARGEITISANNVKHLSLGGSYAKDITGPIKVLSEFVHLQFFETSPALVEGLEKFLADTEAAISVLAKSEQDDEAFRAYFDAIGATMTSQSEAVSEHFAKSAKSIGMMESLTAEGMTTKEFLGAFRIAMKFDHEAGTVSAAVEDQDRPEEEMTVPAMASSQMVDALKSVIAICDDVIKFKNSTNDRNKIYDRLSNFGKNIERNDVADQIAAATTKSLKHVVDASKGVERPLLSKVSLVCASVLAVCGQSLSAHDGKEQKALPAA